MPTTTDETDWRLQFVLSRDLRSQGRESELARDVKRGILTRITRGVYRWSNHLAQEPTARHDDIYLAQVRASHLLSSDPPLFAGLSAAAVWRLPVQHRWPDRVTTATLPAEGGRSNTRLSRSYLAHPAPWVERDGVLVTTLERTIVDVARTASFSQAVMMADAALHGQQPTAHRQERLPASRDEMIRELARFGRANGTAKCRAVLAFADGNADSPGESLSRAAMFVLGFPPPELQVPFVDSHGQIGTVDFWWPEHNLIGEFDGQAKYVREEYTDGRDVASLVLREKKREDRLRALGHTVVRWGWDVASSPSQLRNRLTSAGLRSR